MNQDMQSGFAFASFTLAMFFAGIALPKLAKWEVSFTVMMLLLIAVFDGTFGVITVDTFRGIIWPYRWYRGFEMLVTTSVVFVLFLLIWRLRVLTASQWWQDEPWKILP